MKMILVKICGLSTSESIDAAINAGAEWIGLVHFPKSPRHVSIEAAQALADHARERAKVVSLVVNADDDLLDEIASTVRPDILQFHGKEPPERIQAVKARLDIPIMKAIGVAEREDLRAIQPYIGVADHILLDAKPPKGAELPGGNGATFDWSILDEMPTDFDYLLSGGLTPENVGPAVKAISPFGVDVSSGVESAPGVKDIVLIWDFVKAAKAA